MDLGLADRVYLVTGGSRGLGRATAEVLVAEGARVVLSGRSQESVDAAAAALGDQAVGGRGRQRGPGRAGTARRRGAGAVGPAGRRVGERGRPAAGWRHGVTDEQWTRGVRAVFLGAVRLARVLAGELGEGGSIAFVLSTSVRSPLPDLAVSNGLRPGLAMVAKSLADELAPRGVRVNGLLPGAIRTERLAELGSPPPEPVGRYGEPVEFGRAAAFLLSPAASYVSGAMLPVDGGALRAL